MSFNAVLLDLDGTLLDTIPDLAAAANAMRHDLGMSPLDQALLATYVGKGMKVLVQKTLANNPENTSPDEAMVEQGLAIMGKHYLRTNGDGTRMYPGVREGLDAFAAAGCKLAIVTNKPTEFTHPLLERFGIASLFSAVVCGDTCAQKKPHPMPMLYACEQLGTQPQQALAIGDSVNDALAARAAGITVLAVPYGYNEGMDVRNLQVDDIVSTIADAARWAARHTTHSTRT